MTRLFNKCKKGLCVLAGADLCKQSPIQNWIRLNSSSKLSLEFWVVQLWPTFNRLNFESVSANPVLAWSAFGKSVESAISATCWYKCSNLYACKFSTCGESLFMARNKTLLSFKTPMLCGQVKSADCNSNCQKHPPTMAGMFNDQSIFVYRPIFLRVVVLKAN